MCEGFVVVGVEEAQGHTGGAWAPARRGSGFSFQLVEAMPQCVSVRISKASSSWLYSGVYASPTCTTRCHLWDYLRDFQHRVTIPWALLGDFNYILLSLE